METEPTTQPPQLTTEQILGIIINTLFDIPENSQINVPYESIVKRIHLLKAGFMSLEERQKLDKSFKDLNDEKNSLLSEKADKEFVKSMKALELNTKCEEIKNQEDVIGDPV